MWNNGRKNLESLKNRTNQAYQTVWRSLKKKKQKKKRLIHFRNIFRRRKIISVSWKKVVNGWNAIMRSKRSYHDFTGWIWVMLFLTRQTTISRLIPGSVYKFPSAQSAVARDTRAFWRPKRFPESFPREWWKRDWIWQNCGFFFFASCFKCIFVHFLNILDAGKLTRWHFFFLERKLFRILFTDNV